MVNSVSLFRDRDYIRSLLRIALPIIAQNFVSSTLNMIDVTMIGQLGETAVASVGLANQIFFLMTLMLFGINSGAGVFVAQLWGRQDKQKIHKVQGISLAMGLAASTLFTVIAVIIPRTAMGIYSQDPLVINAGSEYLQIVGLSYIATAITMSFSSVLRATGLVRVPMVVSISAIALKTFLNYSLILGHFGFPALGIEGAAISTVIARGLEVSALLLITYLKRLPPAAHPREMIQGFNRLFMTAVLKTSLPVVANETLWSLGVSVYTIVYAHIGTDSIAAVNIAATIENMAFVLFIGISEACGILVGNRIGADEQGKAFLYARRTLFISVVGAVLMGFVILAASDFVLSFYKISELAHANAQYILRVMSFALWVKVTNMTLIVGILRSGGDTRFSMVLDAGTVWLVGVPIACIGAFVLNLPVYWVYMLIITEELVKLGVGLWRFTSRRWINNLARSV